MAAHIVPTVGMLAIVTAGFAVAVTQDRPAVTAAAPQQDIIAASLEQQPVEVSRSADRAPLPNEAAAQDLVKGTRYALSKLPVHAAASESSPVLATVGKGDTVDITGVASGDWAQVMHKGLPRWVLAKDIAKKMPTPKPKPLGTGPCASGSGVERGLQPDTIKVHRAVCSKFAGVSRYGGLSGRGEHATGQALDIMVSTDLGNQIAAYLQQHSAELGIEYIIWRQRIWRPSTSSAWRGMSDRGGATANHYDHVHVTTYGNAAR